MRYNNCQTNYITQTLLLTTFMMAQQNKSHKHYTTTNNHILPKDNLSPTGCDYSINKCCPIYYPYPTTDNATDTNIPQTNSNSQQTCHNNSSPLPPNLNRRLVVTQSFSTYYTNEKATELYKYYIDNNMPGIFSQLLAKEAVFGPDVIKQCTPNRNGSLYAVPQNGLYKIKK